MRRALAVVLSLLVSGCATHRVPAPSVPEPPSRDWSTVQALLPDTSVFVSQDDGDLRNGAVYSVSDTRLTIREYVEGRGPVLSTMFRAEVARVTVHKEVGKMHPRRDGFIDATFASALLGGLVGLIVGTVKHNDTVSNVSAALFFGSIVINFEMNGRGYSKPKFEDRVVYVRP